MDKHINKLDIVHIYVYIYTNICIYLFVVNVTYSYIILSETPNVNLLHRLLGWGPEG